GRPGMPPSSLIVPEKPRTPPSPTWRWPPRPARLRPEPRRAASAWPSTISCSGSKKSSETRPSFPDPRYSDGRSRDQGTREPGNHANQGTGDPGARRNLSSRAKHTKPVSVAPFYVATSGADIGVGLGAGTYHPGRPRGPRTAAAGLGRDGEAACAGWGRTAAAPDPPRVGRPGVERPA